MSRVPPPRLSAANLSFEIDGSDDILAEALAAVEQRERRRPAPRGPAADLDDEVDDEVDLDMDLPEADVDRVGVTWPGSASHPMAAQPSAAKPPAPHRSAPQPEPSDALGDVESWGAALSDGYDEAPGLPEPITGRLREDPLGDDSLGGRSLHSRGAPSAPGPRGPLAASGSPRELLALREDNDELRAELSELSAELREARRAEEAAHMAVLVAREAAAEQAAEAAALRAAQAATLEEQSRLKATAQRLLREKRTAEDQLSRVNERLSRAEDAKAAADLAALATARSIAELNDQKARLERDLERAHERRKRELEEQRRREATKPLKELLPALDHMHLALAHSADGDHPVTAGLRMIADQLYRSLQKLGLEVISAAPGTPFNPELHEALQRVETDDQPEGAIFAELQPGYTAEGRLLRAARVSVAVRARRVAQPPAAEQGPSIDDNNDHGAALVDEEPVGAAADGEPADSEPADSEPANSEPADSEPANSEAAEGTAPVEAEASEPFDFDFDFAEPDPPTEAAGEPTGSAGSAAAEPDDGEGDGPAAFHLQFSPLDDPTLELPVEPDGDPPDPSRA